MARRINVVDKQVMDNHTILLKFTKQMVEEAKRVLQAKIDCEIIVVKADLMWQVNKMCRDVNEDL